MVVGLVPLLSCTISDGLQPMALLGWILFILAIAVPAKAILGKNPPKESPSFHLTPMNNGNCRAKRSEHEFAPASIEGCEL